MNTKYICILVLILSISLAGAQSLISDSMVMISVSISGQVENPGTYKISRVDRLSDLVYLAQMPDPALPDEARSPEDIEPLLKVHPIPELRADAAGDKPESVMMGLRHLQLMRQGEKSEYDLLSFYRRGDIGQNPFLRDGDHVHVPAAAELVEISGAVAMPGKLEYKAGDTVGDLLELALGPIPGADLAALRLSSYQGGDASYQVRSLNLEEDASLRDLKLHAGDLLMVPLNSRYQKRRMVTISGEVLYQGDYQITRETGIWDLIQSAGGLTQDADLDNALILNQDFNAEPDPEFEHLKQHNFTELSPIEYSYMRAKMHQAKGRYSVDFRRIIETEGAEGEHILQAGDQIYIPPKLDMIWVSGHVDNPGLIPFVEGKNWRYYVEQAGGYDNNRRYMSIRVMLGDSGNWVKPKKDMELHPGDMIFVPDKRDRSFWTDVRDIIGVTASAITILIGVQNLAK